MLTIFRPALVLAACLAAGPGPALAEGPGLITVTGQARVTVEPDLATLSLGVTTQGATAAQALGANSAALARVIERLAAAGIAARDIQTSNLSLTPNYTAYDSGLAPQIQNYTATNMVTVTIRALDRTGAVLDASVRDGANMLYGLGFGLADPRPQEDAARRAAVADAQAKAALLAEATGVGLGEVQSIVEGGGYAPPEPMYRMAAEAAAVPVAAGSLEIAASVTIVWEIAP